MAKKSTNIYKRKDGRWEGRYKNGYTAGGKTRYSSVYGKSYSAVKELLEEKLAAVRRSYSVKSSYVFNEIANNWLADVQNKVKLSTLSNYTMKLNKHILPYFAGVKFDKLTADNVNTLITDKIVDYLLGITKNKKPYPQNMVKQNIIMIKISKQNQKLYYCKDKYDRRKMPLLKENNRWKPDYSYEDWIYEVAYDMVDISDQLNGKADEYECQQVQLTFYKPTPTTNLILKNLLIFLSCCDTME